MADKTTTLKTKTNDNVYPNIIGDNRDNAISDSAHINHTLTAEHKINFRLDTNVSGLIFNSLQKPAGLTKTKLVGVGTNGQENIEIGDNLTLANGKLSATGGSSGSKGGISVIELTDKNGTIASTQLGEINANPQNFTFKYNGKILLFTKADSTTYQYCNNTTSSSDNNVMTTSTLLTIKSSTGVYTIVENVHNVVANSIHPANGGDLTDIQVGSKVYSIPSGGGGISIMTEICSRQNNIEIPAGNYRAGQMLQIISEQLYPKNKGKTFLIVPRNYSYDMNDIPVLLTYIESYVEDDYDRFDIRYLATFLTDITLSEPAKASLRAVRYYIPVE